MARKQKKQTKTEHYNKIAAFYEVLNMCGDPAKSAALVNMGMEQAYRQLRKPDGYAKLQEIQDSDMSQYYSMSPAQLKSFLSQGAVAGVLPRVLLDMTTGLPLTDSGGNPVLIFEYVSEAVRIRCIEMLAKILGMFIDKKVIEFEDSKKLGELSAAVEEKLQEIHNHKSVKRIGLDDDPLAL